MDFQTLNLLFRCNKEFSHTRIRKLDLSDTEYMICSYIYSHENCSQDDVSIALKTDKTTVGKALASLEKKNCIIRLQDEADKRIKRLFFTEKGRNKISEVIDIHNNWLKNIMTSLSEEEQKQFEKCCDKLLGAALNLTNNQGENDR